MKIISSVIGIFVLFTFYTGSMVQADAMKMPMRFKAESNYEEILKSYPLGSMKKLAVLSHHGKADNVIQLPNGSEGWVYDLGIHRTPKAYITPSGKELVVKERGSAGKKQTYTLVFDKDGHVMDVLYEANDAAAISALLLQHKASMNH